MRSFDNLEELTVLDLELLHNARSVADRAFNPVSRFSVGAAVRSTDGKIYIGTFMETSALPLGVCAEPAALLAAISDGASGYDAIAVVGGDPRSTSPDVPITPCGGCRQRIFDVTGGETVNVRLLCSNLPLSLVLEFSISELLPHAFSSSDLPREAWQIGG